MLKRSIVVLGLLLAGGTSALAASSTASTKRAEQRLVASDEVVLNRLHAINQHEVHAGQLAEVQANGQAVRDFGDRLVQDHARNDRELSVLAHQEGISLTGANSPNVTLKLRRDYNRERKDMDKLAKLSGCAFDQKFLSSMEQGHLDALAYLQQVQASTQSEAIRSFVTQTIPTIEQHRQLAHDLRTGSISNTASLSPSLNEPTMSGAGAYSCPYVAPATP